MTKRRSRREPKRTENPREIPRSADSARNDGEGQRRKNKEGKSGHDLSCPYGEKIQLEVAEEVADGFGVVVDGGAAYFVEV